MSAAAPERGPLRGALTLMSGPPFLTGLAALMAAGALVLGLANLWGTHGPLHADGTACCGDFTAFWTGGYFVAEGRGHELYDLDAQQAYQASIVGEQSGSWQAYLYPPTLALLVAPAVPWGYPAAFAWFAAMGAVALLGAFAALWPLLTRWDAVERATALLMMFAYAPVATTLLGGQTSGLALAVWIGHYASVRSGKPLLAGLFLGLLVFKPQFVLLLAAWHLLRGDVRTLGAAFVTGALQGLAGAVFMGVDWPLRFLAAIRGLSAARAWEIDAPKFLSLPSALGWSLGAPGRGLAWGLVGALLLALVVVGRRLRPEHEDFPLFYAAMVLLSVIGAPHAMFYDNALIVLPAVLWLERSGGGLPLWARVAVGLLWLGYPMYTLSERIGFQPLTAEMLLLTVGLLVRLRPGPPATA